VNIALAARPKVVILSAAKDLLLHFHVFGWNGVPCQTAVVFPIYAIGKYAPA